MRFTLAYIIVFCALACSEKKVDADPNDPVLAAVFAQQLKLSDLKPILQTEVSAEDSLLYAHSLVEKWVRNAILMHEAESNIPADLDIQKMVNDYRSSLILMTYKQKLVQEKLDTSVTQEQLESYYELQKSQYRLDEPILQCIFLKIDTEREDYDRLDRLWKNSKFDELSLESDHFFELKLTTENEWYTWKDIKALVPKNFWTWSEVKTKAPRHKISGDFKYYIKVDAFEDKKQIAPLSYIKDQAAKVILHKRQTELLDNLVEDLYNQYSTNNNVKINI